MTALHCSCTAKACSLVAGFKRTACKGGRKCQSIQTTCAPPKLRIVYEFLVEAGCELLVCPSSGILTMCD